MPRARLTYPCVSLSRARRIAGPEADAVLLLRRATWWIDASDASAGGQTVTNLGTGGSALDAQAGSTGGADTNDPRHLAHTGTNYIYAPGAATGDNLSIPHVAGEQVGDVMDIRIDMAADDWTPAGALFIAGKSTSLVAASTSWAVGLDSSNRFYFTVSDGTTIPLWRPAVLASDPFVDGQRLRLRVTYTRNTGGGSYAMGLDYSQDFTTPLGDIASWTNLSSTTGTSIGATQDIANPMYVTSYRNSTAGVPGRYYGLHLKVGGVTKVDADYTKITTGAATTYTGSTGQVWAIQRATSGRKVCVVTTPVWLFGTDDVLTVPDTGDALDFGATDSFTVLAVIRRHTTAATAGVVWKRAGNTPALTADPGWHISQTSTLVPSFRITDGAVSAAATLPTPTAGGVAALVGVRSVAADTVSGSTNGTAGTPVADGTTGTMANAELLRIGSMTSGSYLDAELLAAAVWRRALTAAEIATLSTWFASRWP